MSELTKLPNIAARLEAQLTEVGITMVGELRQVGSQEAWFGVRLITKR